MDVGHLVQVGAIAVVHVVEDHISWGSGLLDVKQSVEVVEGIRA